MVLAAGLIVCIVLFLSIKVDLHRRPAVSPHGERIEQTVDSLSAAFEQIRERLDEPAPAPTVTWSGTPAVNLTRRGQVLRLFRRGDSPRQIASSLGMRKGEVDLIVKVHQMALNRSNSAAGGAI
jgi:DNA-binding NarL/FixJ family response regulator